MKNIKIKMILKIWEDNVNLQKNKNKKDTL